MNKKQYEAMRRKLMAEAQGLLDAGKIEEANAKMEEVKALDQKWDAIAQAAGENSAPRSCGGCGRRKCRRHRVGRGAA